MELDKMETKCLLELWRDVDLSKFGLDLIEPVCKERNHLRRFIQVEETFSASRDRVATRRMDGNDAK